MLEKNKDYVEFTLQYTSVDWARSKDCPEVCLKGYSDFSFPGVPIMDVVCNEFDHKVVVVSKKDFEKMQADNQRYLDTIEDLKNRLADCQAVSSAKHKVIQSWKKITGFSSCEDIEDYLVNEAECETLRKAIASLEYNVKFARDERRDLSKKAEALRTENEQLKKKLEEFTPAPGYEEFLKALYPEANEETIKKLVWVTKHTFGCGDLRHTLQVDLEYYRAISSAQAKTLYSWKEVTGCATPEEAKTLIESGASWHHAYNEVKAANEELKKKLHEFDPIPDYKELLEKLYSKDDVEKLEWTLNHICGGQASVNGWKATAKFWRQNCETISKLVGFSSVEEIQDYLTNGVECDTLHEAISKLHDEVKDTSHKWASANRINNSWKAAAECNSPTDFLKWKTNIEAIMEAWRSATGCAYPADARRLLEKWKAMTKCETPEAAATWITSYEKACERGNELAEGAGEREKAWQDATGRISPEAAKQYIDRLKGRLNKIHGYAMDW